MDDNVAVENEAVAVENEARIGRVTAGWKKADLPLELVRPYWRDAHSPAIARRAGIWEYRHYPLDVANPTQFAGLGTLCAAPPKGEQLMWLSDVRYRDQAGLDAFGRSPPAAIRARILGDIELIVDRSTTYLVLGENGRTFIDRTGAPAPLGPATKPSFALFLRRRGAEAPFRAALRDLAVRWAAAPGVSRLRLSLFETPDMEAERRAGYPVKTHDPAQQYQAWIDLVTEDDAAAGALDAGAAREALLLVHAFAVPAIYTFNYRGRPTLAGLRGFAACEAIRNLAATHQKSSELLAWMYGEPGREAPHA